MDKQHLQHQISAGSDSTQSFPGIFMEAEVISEKSDTILWGLSLPPDSVSARTEQELESLYECYLSTRY